MVCSSSAAIIAALPNTRFSAATMPVQSTPSAIFPSHSPRSTNSTMAAGGVDLPINSCVPTVPRSTMGHSTNGPRVIEDPIARRPAICNLPASAILRTNFSSASTASSSSVSRSLNRNEGDRSHEMSR